MNDCLHLRDLNMESKTIKCPTIYLTFKSEFFCEQPQQNILYEFSKFINSKDLGVISTDYINDIYEIVDEKKWLFSKLKYGI